MKWWTKKEPYPGRGIIPRDKNPYKGNTSNKPITPSDWKLLEMDLRTIIKDEIRNLKKKNPQSWKRLSESVAKKETVSADVAGYQDGMEEYGLRELKELYGHFNEQKSHGLGEASKYAINLAEQLLDEDNFEMRNTHGLQSMKRNSKYLGKLSEELEKVNDALNTNRMQALALIDEIGMIAHRYHGKK